MSIRKHLPKLIPMALLHLGCILLFVSWLRHSESIRSTSVQTFGTAVDTNHWFKVNDLGYYVLVRTNVWPVQRPWIDRSPPTPLTNYDTGTPLVTYPNAVYLGKWKIYALHGGTNSLYIESIRNPSIVFTFHDFERGGGL